MRTGASAATRARRITGGPWHPATPGSRASHRARPRQRFDHASHRARQRSKSQSCIQRARTSGPTGWLLAAGEESEMFIAQPRRSKEAT